jgi:hypothetical protein
LRANHWEFLRLLVPALSSPAHGAASLAMALRRIEVVFVLWDDLKLTSGISDPTATAKLIFSKITDPLKTLTFALF